MKAAPASPRAYMRAAGRRPEDGVFAPVPWKLAYALRDHAQAKGLKIDKLERSRAKISASLYLTMRDAAGRQWRMRISNHLRPRRTGHAMPHLDFVSFDGSSGLALGCSMIDRIVSGAAEWFDADATVRCLPHTKRRKGMRQCRR